MQTETGNPEIAEIELVYRGKTKPSERPPVNSSKAAYDLLLNSWDKDKIELQEQFRVMLLDSKSSCLGIATLSTGGLSSCFVDLKHIFALALKANASAIIVAHNHPSGNVTPSQADKSLTARFASAAAVLDIKLQDHIIVSAERYTSFSDEGIISSPILVMT